MSAKPPVFENGCTSLLASRILMKAADAPAQLIWSKRAALDLFASGLDPVSLQVFLQRLGNLDAAIRLLVGFHQRHKQPGQGRAAPV